MGIFNERKARRYFARKKDDFGEGYKNPNLIEDQDKNIEEQKSLALDLLFLNRTLSKYGARIERTDSTENLTSYKMMVGKDTYEDLKIPKVGTAVIRNRIFKKKVLDRLAKKHPNVWGDFRKLEKSPFMVIGEYAPSSKNLTSSNREKTLEKRLATSLIAVIFVAIIIMTFLKTGLVTGLAIETFSNNAFTAGFAILFTLLIILLFYKFKKK